MEGSEVIDRKLKRLCENDRRQQVDGIPDAAVAENPVNRGEQRHGDTSRQATFDPCGDGIDLDWNAQPAHFRGNSSSGYLGLSGDDLNGFRLYGNHFMLLVWENVAEPANRTHDHQQGAYYA